MNEVHDRLQNRSRSHARQQGVTLVELMISLVLGMLLTAGIIQVFVGNRVTYVFNDNLSRIQENARFALDHMAYQTRMAGYKGCISDVTIYNNLKPPFDFGADLGNGLQAHDAQGTRQGDEIEVGEGDNVWTPPLPAELAAKNPLPGSDVLIVRSVGGAGQPLVWPFTNAAQIFVATPHDLIQGEILVVTDCQKASIFQVTNIDKGGINLVHSQAGSYTPGNAISNWGGEQDYGLGAEVARLQTYAFYVGLANGRPTLFQLRLSRKADDEAGFEEEALAEGVESMQLRFGIDTAGNGSINDWVTADDVGNWSSVLSVEIALLASASGEYGKDRDTATYNLAGTDVNAPGDRRLRQVFSTSVGVRNRLP